MNMITRLALSVAVVGAVTATTLGQAVADTPAPSAAASSAANPGFLTHFTPTVPNPTTASAAQLAAGRPVGAFATLTGDSSAGGSISRAEVIARAQSWVDAGVPYSMTSYRTDANGKYRTDCSGFVSMAWHLDSSSGNNWGETTGTLLNYTSSIAKESLKPGDVLLNPDSAPAATWSSSTDGPAPITPRTTRWRSPAAAAPSTTASRTPTTAATAPSAPPLRQHPGHQQPRGRHG